MKLWEKCKVNEKNTILQVLQVIDSSSLQIALVVDEKNRLLGTITDGDVRRAILKGISIEENIIQIMNRNPIFVEENQERYSILKKMKEKELNQIPVVNSEGIVVDLISLKELTYSKRKENAVVLMVGGLGTRLRPLTNTCPKPLLKVGNKPILETILESFIEAGFYRFYFAVNYKSDMIENYFGNGSRFGVDIQYIHEKKRMGTAGALGLLPRNIELPVIVMNGDLLTKVNFEQLLEYHQNQNALATMAVREYNYQIPYGVIDFNETRITGIQEKPRQTFFVNAGIYVLSAKVLQTVDAEKFFDMPDLFSKIIESGQVAAAFPIREYWLDIGKLDDFEKAQGEFEEIFK